MSALIPIGTLPSQSWLNEAPTQKIMSALNQAEEPQALFVGGCVRNALLKIDVPDIDIATIHTPEETINLLKQAGFKTIPTGIEHGTITAVIDGCSFEVTTLRKDIATDGRRATVSWTQDWTQDAQRRDFTMNTLLADQKGNLYDPLGCGIEDLNARRVLFVGDPTARIAEDYLRILRFFRFLVLYGAGQPDKAALSACASAAHNIESLSKERITQEIFKILMAKNPAPILSIMNAHNIIKPLQFKTYNAEHMDKLCTLQHEHSLENLAARLLMLAGLEDKNIKAINETLLVPKAHKKQIKSLLNVQALPALENEHAIKVALYRQGSAPTAQILLMNMAHNKMKNIDLLEALELAQNWPIPKFPISGNDLIKQGQTPGAQLGSKLASLEEDWIERGFERSE